jgi:hypothetical protein
MRNGRQMRRRGYKGGVDGAEQCRRNEGEQSE